MTAARAFGAGSAVVVAIAALGCGSAPTGPKTGWQADASGMKGAASGSEAERFFPMVDGNIYSYRTAHLGDDGSEAGVLMMKVHRDSPTSGELRKPASSQRFEYGPVGIATTTKTGNPAYLFKWPLTPEARWLGPQGGESRLGSKDVTITTPAGTFSGCLAIIEERRGDLPTRVTTTVCPDVGIVSLEVSSGGAVERAELVYYGAPMDVGPEGTRRVE